MGQSGCRRLGPAFQTIMGNISSGTECRAIGHARPATLFCIVVLAWETDPQSLAGGWAGYWILKGMKWFSLPDGN
jgi:hypothetical protein